MVENVEFL